MERSVNVPKYYIISSNYVNGNNYLFIENACVLSINLFKEALVLPFSIIKSNKYNIYGDTTFPSVARRMSCSVQIAVE